jgi:hypothetical protein
VRGHDFRMGRRANRGPVWLGAPTGTNVACSPQAASTALRRDKPTQPSPANPSKSIAQVEGSGTLVAWKLSAEIERNSR